MRNNKPIWWDGNTTTAEPQRVQQHRMTGYPQQPQQPMTGYQQPQQQPLYPQQPPQPMTGYQQPQQQPMYPQNGYVQQPPQPWYSQPVAPAQAYNRPSGAMGYVNQASPPTPVDPRTQGYFDTEETASFTKEDFCLDVSNLLTYQQKANTCIPYLDGGVYLYARGLVDSFLGAKVKELQGVNTNLIVETIAKDYLDYLNNGKLPFLPGPKQCGVSDKDALTFYMESIKSLIADGTLGLVTPYHYGDFLRKAEGGIYKLREGIEVPTPPVINFKEFKTMADRLYEDPFEEEPFMPKRPLVKEPVDKEVHVSVRRKKPICIEVFDPALYKPKSTVMGETGLEVEEDEPWATEVENTDVVDEEANLYEDISEEEPYWNTEEEEEIEEDAATSDDDITEEAIDVLELANVLDTPELIESPVDDKTIYLKGKDIPDDEVPPIVELDVDDVLQRMAEHYVLGLEEGSITPILGLRIPKEISKRGHIADYHAQLMQLYNNGDISFCFKEDYVDYTNKASNENIDPLTNEFVKCLKEYIGSDSKPDKIPLYKDNYADVNITVSQDKRQHRDTGRQSGVPSKKASSASDDNESDDPDPTEGVNNMHDKLEMISILDRKDDNLVDVSGLPFNQPFFNRITNPIIKQHLMQAVDRKVTDYLLERYNVREVHLLPNEVPLQVVSMAGDLSEEKMNLTIAAHKEALNVTPTALILPSRYLGSNNLTITESPLSLQSDDPISEYVGLVRTDIHASFDPPTMESTNATPYPCSFSVINNTDIDIALQLKDNGGNKPVMQFKANSKHISLQVAKAIHGGIVEPPKSSIVVVESMTINAGRLAKYLKLCYDKDQAIVNVCRAEKDNKAYSITEVETTPGNWLNTDRALDSLRNMVTSAGIFLTGFKASKAALTIDRLEDIINNPESGILINRDDILNKTCTLMMYTVISESEMLSHNPTLHSFNIHSIYTSSQSETRSLSENAFITEYKAFHTDDTLAFKVYLHNENKGIPITIYSKLAYSGSPRVEIITSKPSDSNGPNTILDSKVIPLNAKERLARYNLFSESDPDKCVHYIGSEAADIINKLKEELKDEKKKYEMKMKTFINKESIKELESASKLVVDTTLKEINESVDLTGTASSNVFGLTGNDKVDNAIDQGGGVTGLKVYPSVANIKGALEKLTPNRLNKHVIKRKEKNKKIPCTKDYEDHEAKLDKRRQEDREHEILILTLKAGMSAKEKKKSNKKKHKAEKKKHKAQKRLEKKKFKAQKRLEKKKFKAMKKTDKRRSKAIKKEARYGTMKSLAVLVAAAGITTLLGKYNPTGVSNIVKIAKDVKLV